MTIPVKYYVDGVGGTDTADQLQGVARSLAVTAVEKLKEA